MEPKLTVGKVARAAGVNVETIRYYERRGLLSPNKYLNSGYRLYTEEAVQKIRFIKNAQELGFTLNEIKGLLRLRVGQRTRCEDVRKKSQAKLKQVDEKILRLRSMRRVLQNLIQSCQKRNTTEACPILKSLEGEKR